MNFNQQQEIQLRLFKDLFFKKKGAEVPTKKTAQERKLRLKKNVAATETQLR